MAHNAQPRTTSARVSPLTRRLARVVFGALVLVALKPVAPAQTTPSVSGAAPRVRTEMLVSTDWLAQHLRDRHLVVLCIASQEDFCAKGRIPGARFIPLSAMAVTRNGVPNELPPAEELKRVFESAGVSKRSRIVLYGERSNLFAARAYFTLDYLGVSGRAALLNGGVEKWKAEGRALATEAPKVRPAKLAIKPNPQVLVTLDRMQQVSQDASATIVDARPLDDYSGAKAAKDSPKAGHIPHAASLFWMKTLESPANPVLRPEAELRQMFAAAGATSERPVVSYCHSGMQASFDYFVAKYLGYQASMYDGSFSEWSQHDLPVESDAKK